MYNNNTTNYPTRTQSKNSRYLQKWYHQKNEVIFFSDDSNSRSRVDMMKIENATFRQDRQLRNLPLITHLCTPISLEKITLLTYTTIHYTYIVIPI